MSAWPDLEELIWLFEAEPHFEFEDLGYPNAATSFRTTRGDTHVQCTIEPYLNSLTVRVLEGDEQRLRLHRWRTVERLVVDRVHGAEALVATIVPEVPSSELRLTLKPNPSVSWAAGSLSRAIQ